MDNQTPQQRSLDLGLEWTEMEDADGTPLVVPDDVGHAQRLVFESMLQRWNNFDGFQIVRDLIRHRTLWQGVAFLQSDPLLTLRDIAQGWHADTLYIHSSEADDAMLLRLIESWSPDQIGNLSSSRLVESGLRQRVYEVWWD